MSTPSQIICLKSQGKPTPAIHEVAGFGAQRIRTVIHRHEWLHVYGFVCPESGESEF